jgi:hypothetical protein
MTAARGQCLCGVVRFTVETVDPECWACHCNMCVRWSAGPFLSVSTTSAKFEGEDNITIFDSSEWAERGFCRQCGTILYYRLKKRDGLEMNIGVFDDPPPIRLAGEIFVDRKPGTFEFAGDHPRLTEAEAIERFSLS